MNKKPPKKLPTKIRTQLLNAHNDMIDAQSLYNSACLQIRELRLWFDERGIDTEEISNLESFLNDNIGIIPTCFEEELKEVAIAYEEYIEKGNYCISDD